MLFFLTIQIQGIICILEYYLISITWHFHNLILSTDGFFQEPVLKHFSFLLLVGTLFILRDFILVVLARWKLLPIYFLFYVIPRYTLLSPIKDHTERSFLSFKGSYPLTSILSSKIALQNTDYKNTKYPAIQNSD